MPPETDQQERRVITARSVWIGLGLGIPITLLFLWLAVRGVDVDDVWGALKRASAVFVVAAIPCMLVFFTMQGLRWRHLVEAPVLPRRRAFVVLMFVGTAITNVVPGRPGDVARGVWLSRLGRIPVARTLTSVGVDRAIDVGTVFLMLLLCLPFVGSPTWLITLGVAAAAVSVIAGGVLVTAWWFARSRGDRPDQMERGDRSWVRYHLSGVLRGLAVLSRPRDVVAAILLGAIGWGGWILGTWLVGYSLGLQIGLSGAMLVTSVIALGSAIPSSPGMIGTFQWLCVASLGVIGVGKADALAFSILLQATWYIPTTLSGVPGAWWLAREGRKPLPQTTSEVAVPS